MKRVTNQGRDIKRVSQSAVMALNAFEIMRAMAYAVGGRESLSTDFAAIISLGEISEGGSGKVPECAGGTLIFRSSGPTEEV